MFITHIHNHTLYNHTHQNTLSPVSSANRWAERDRLPLVAAWAGSPTAGGDWAARNSVSIREQAGLSGGLLFDSAIPAAGPRMDGRHRISSLSKSSAAKPSFCESRPDKSRPAADRTSASAKASVEVKTETSLGPRLRCRAGRDWPASCRPHS